jgi:hypothetical protein
VNPVPLHRPTSPSPWLIDRRTNPQSTIDVAVTRGIPRSRLAEVERTWNPARAALNTAVRAAGFGLENSHWDWRNKLQYYPSDWHCLVAIEAAGDVQGLMALETKLRSSALRPSTWIVYVDFVEAAPWNRREPPDRRHQPIQSPRFAGVGTLLIGEAIRASMGRATNGRIGLHALPGAEDFYALRCRMARIGSDPNYHGLTYFEYPEGVAVQWLTDVGFSA